MEFVAPFELITHAAVPGHTPRVRSCDDQGLESGVRSQNTERGGVGRVPGMTIASARGMNGKPANRRTKGLPKVGGKSSGKVKSAQTRTPRLAAEDRSSRADRNELQTSSKIGVESGSQKEDKLRYKTDVAPASTPVPGAFGRTGSLSESEEEMVHPEEDAEGNRKDFVAERRRQNLRARK